MPREILVDWTGVQGGGMTSVLYFDTGSTVTAQREILSDALTLIKAVVSSTAAYTIRTAGREFNDATGTLVDEWDDSAPFTSAGGSIGSAPVPDAAQGLIRWQTGAIVNGRFVRGRTFIPGLRGDMANGNLSASDISALQNGANALIAGAVGFGVWHRPVNGAGGSFHTASGASVWGEYAILRRRRK